MSISARRNSCEARVPRYIMKNHCIMQLAYFERIYGVKRSNVVAPGKERVIEAVSSGERKRLSPECV